VKFGPGGNHLWSERFGDVNDQDGAFAAVDESGNVVVNRLFLRHCGFRGWAADDRRFGRHLFGGVLIQAEITFGASVSVGVNDQGAYDVRRLRMGKGHSDRLFHSTVDFGGGLLTAAGGNPDMFLVKFGHVGTGISSLAHGGRTASRCLPEPLKAQTTIHYSAPGNGVVRLRVYDASGRLVQVLVDEQKLKGEYTAVWDGRGIAGQFVASGCVLLAGWSPAEWYRPGSFVLLR